MEFPTWLVKVAKSGILTISRNETKALQLRLKEKSLDVNIIDKKFLKTVLEGGAKGGSLMDLVRLIRELSESLNVSLPRMDPLLRGFLTRHLEGLPGGSGGDRLAPSFDLQRL